MKGNYLYNVVEIDKFYTEKRMGKDLHNYKKKIKQKNYRQH